jgi:hypothetical protein
MSLFRLSKFLFRKLRICILQAEEAQKMRKRKKAENSRLLDIERRSKERLEEVRETLKKLAIISSKLVFLMLIIHHVFIIIICYFDFLFSFI